jgi:hypothetical protein
MTIELEKEDKVISEFLNSIGPWRSYIVIGGGYAPIIYKLYLSDKELKMPPVGTRDIDSLIPRKIPKISEKNISGHLFEAGFKRIFKDYDEPPTESYVKEIHGLDVEIEFLTDSSARFDKNKNVVIAGVAAQPLSYLNLSLQKTIKFTTYSFESGLVVSPEAWIFHKGLTFTSRTSTLKSLKDLYGIWYVTAQLGDFSKKTVDNFYHLSRMHTKWYKTFQKNLHNWIENAAPIEWSKLEAQDPFGILKKLNFEWTIKKLIHPNK